MKQEKKITPELIDFVSVGLKFCNLLENTSYINKELFINNLRSILSLLYYRYTLLESIEDDTLNESLFDNTNYITISEDDYNFILLNIKKMLEYDDEYLEVFLEDMKYSESPIICYISESLADIYQFIRPFLEYIKTENSDMIGHALKYLFENYKESWGQQLVNVLRALHNISIKSNDIEYENFI